MKQQIDAVYIYFTIDQLKEEITEESLGILQRYYAPDHYYGAVSDLQTQYHVNGERFIELIEQDYKVTILGGGDEI